MDNTSLTLLQLDRIEKKLDTVVALVHHHAGVIAALKWGFTSLSVLFGLLITYLNFKKS